ncbi:MAG: hypothetical protein K9G62_00650 [Alphaproteobacteria bacterium]|nr:hypothetical protein [Alphaproteobacteria bacterium]
MVSKYSDSGPYVTSFTAAAAGLRNDVSFADQILELGKQANLVVIPEGGVVYTENGKHFTFRDETRSFLDAPLSASVNTLRKSGLDTVEWPLNFQGNIELAPVISEIQDRVENLLLAHEEAFKAQGGNDRVSFRDNGDSITNKFGEASTGTGVPAPVRLGFTGNGLE